MNLRESLPERSVSGHKNRSGGDVEMVYDIDMKLA